MGFVVVDVVLGVYLVAVLLVVVAEVAAKAVVVVLVLAAKVGVVVVLAVVYLVVVFHDGSPAFLLAGFSPFSFLLYLVHQLLSHGKCTATHQTIRPVTFKRPEPSSFR